jgi:hypothetical protein
VKKRADDRFKDKDRKKQVNTTKNPKRDLSPEARQELDKGRTRKLPGKGRK